LTRSDSDLARELQNELNQSDNINNLTNGSNLFPPIRNNNNVSYTLFIQVFSKLAAKKYNNSLYVFSLIFFLTLYYYYR
jgi:hypothetical protein